MLRKIVFWLHLTAGVVAGVVILILSLTGAALAFEKDLVAWADRSVRRVQPSAAHATALPLSDLLERVRRAHPGEVASNLVLDADPTVALLVTFGRTNLLYVNPYTGDARPPTGTGMRTFMRRMMDWHRYLGGHNERRALGKAITGAANAAFLCLALTGLYLWWPRQWTRISLRSAGLMNLRLRGKARDWNWHNAVGLWTAPVLIVLTATALPISYQWAGNLIYRLAGSPMPAPGGPGAGGAPAVTVPSPPEGARPLGTESLIAAAQREMPHWRQITVRTGGPAGRGSRGGATRESTSGLPGNDSRRGTTSPGDAAPRLANRPGRGAEEEHTMLPVVVAVAEQGAWPRFASTQLSMDPFTGAVLRREGFGDLSRGRQIRSWTRFLHTGEALGVAGQAVAGLASAAAALLVWTGLALTWRRFFGRRSAPVEAAPAELEYPAEQSTAKESQSPDSQP